MPLELFLGLCAFAFSSTLTPGPNNAMLLASGANFGFRRTIPHMLGVGLGFPLMVLLVALGFGAVFDAVPGLQTVLRYLGAAYLAYLAVRIARARPTLDGTTTGRPLSFLAAAGFQWVNPKAWVMATGAVTAFLPQDAPVWAALLLPLAFVMSGCVSTTTWTTIGTGVRVFVRNPLHLRLFNYAMAGLLLLSLVPILAP